MTTKIQRKGGSGSLGSLYQPILPSGIAQETAMTEATAFALTCTGTNTMVNFSVVLAEMTIMAWDLMFVSLREIMLFSEGTKCVET